MNDVVLQGSITKYVKRLLLDKIIDDTPLQAPKGSVIFKENEQKSHHPIDEKRRTSRVAQRNEPKYY